MSVPPPTKHQLALMIWVAVFPTLTVINLALEESTTQLQEVVIEAAAIRNTENAILAMQKKSVALQDGLSVQEIARTGAGNAAESAKQITGTSVVDGRYVYVRGLGDRYSIAQLNGASLVSADPYVNSVPLDLIPSNLLDNIITVKTATPDQPGNFSGGIVNLVTRKALRGAPSGLSVEFGSHGRKRGTARIGRGLSDGHRLRCQYRGTGEKGTSRTSQQPAMTRTQSNLNQSVDRSVADHGAS